MPSEKPINFIHDLKSYKISIYSGTIPSTAFIERLICGLESLGIQIALFGTITKDKPDYSSNVKIYGIKSGWKGRLKTLYRIAHLALRFPGHFKILKSELNCLPWQGNEAFALWKRHVPVILHLPDIFHIQWAKGTEEWLYLKKHFGVKLIVSLRGAHINYSPLSQPELRESYRRSFPRVDAFHAVSHAIAKEAQKYGADSNKIKVIYSGLHPLITKNQRIKIRNAVNGDVLKLLVVGRFHWKKGYVDMLEALHILQSRGVLVNLTLIASGKMPEEELYLIHEFKLQDLVVHIKGLPFIEVQQAMHDHDALILPSLEEGIANVALEAMQMGLPVISTDCGGMGEAIRHGENGFLVPVRNPTAIADAVESLMLMTDVEYNEMIKNARYTIDEKFNLNLAASEFVLYYKQLIDS
jgi:colanic acid/amylovoran biosynthesis glycosyltransferase